MKKGDIIGGRYEIVGALGEGGFSQVYLGNDLRLNSECAIKVVKDSDHVANLLNEVNMLSKLRYWRLPILYDVVTEEDSICIIEEFIAGKTLKKLLEEDRTCSESKAIDIFLQLCDILLYMHDNNSYPVIHRDIKPENIIITKNGDIRLIDLGSAREFDLSKRNDTQIIGTFGYIAPEVMMGNQSDEQSDIYSLGITMYQSLTGMDPSNLNFKITNTSQISRAFFRIIQKCTKPTPSNRYQSIAEIKSALQKLQTRRTRPKKFYAVSAILTILLIVNLSMGVINILQITNLQNPFFFEENITLSQSVTELIGKEVTIQAFNSLYFSIGDNDEEKLYAISDRITDKERFTVVQVDNNMIAFETSDGRYLSADPDGRGAITSTAKEIGRSESFYIQYLGIKENGSRFFCIRTLNGFFWTSDLSNSGYLYTKSKEMGGGWETFVITVAD